MRALRRFARPPKLLGRIAIAAVLVMLGLAYGYAARRGETAGERLAHALLAERFTTGRLTGQRAWQACAVVDTAALVPNTRCGEPLDPRSRRSRRFTALGSAVRAAPQPDSSSTALRGLALLDLRVADTATAPLERAVSALEQAHRLAPDDAGLLNELAVGNLALGERTQQLTPMLRALDAIERAVEKDSVRTEILFNRALIQQRLYLIGSAGRAWARYLAVERDPAWRAEAQAHARWVAQVPDTVSWDSLLAAPPVRMDATTRATIAARVRRSPQKAREFGFPLLSAWGAAVQVGDSARAARLLAVAREIGTAERDLGVDESVRLAVDAIDAAGGDRKRTAALAQGHLYLATGKHAYSRNEYGDAARLVARAERALQAGGSPAARWAAFYRATAALNNVDYAGSDSLFDRLAREAGPDEPALRARVVWGMGLSQLRRGALDPAIHLYRQAVPLVERTGESESRGSIAVVLGEGLAMAGQSDAARVEAYKGLRGLSPFRAANILANHLAIVSSYAREERLSHAALAITTEQVAVARAVDKPGVMALALCARVRDLITLDRPDAARVVLDEATRWSARIPKDRGGERVQAQVALTLGQLTRARDPRAALPALEEAVEKYTAYGTDLYLSSALYEAALAARAAGEPARAREWLQRAIDFIDGQQAAFSKPGEGASFTETVENVWDEMIALDVDEGRWEAAFHVLERGRLPARGGEARRDGARPGEAPATLAAVSRALPHDMLLVEYAVLRDRLVVWTASRHGARQFVVPVPRDTLATLAELVSGGSSVEAANGAAARLFHLLLRPLAPDLDGIHQLTIVPDRELYRVPFAALRDRVTGRYAVESYRLRTVPSAAFYLAAAGEARPDRTGGRALVIGNPQVDTASAGALGPLPGAAREARRIAEMYRDHTLLEAGDARRGRVLELLPSHGMVHFAGHAVFNPRQPELSYLALAPDGPGGGGILRAGEIAELRLSNVQVVVLSACSSLSARPSRTGAVAGLAFSFLRAGAPATVSTLWDVEDGATAELLVRFHGRMAAGTPAAEALRLAQVDALRSGRPGLRDPRVWAAFIYTGP